ncbi:hypothetical protein KUL17_24320 [Alteromonas sp. KUL17]|uniref:hypothetical protein n=1 Tax=Alteromonas sp. KUL17 TaxID=2480796 RepID=UPI0010377FD9|nr:hypothetical protein [Alteromonas sp. KUL17]TAP25504.1 hypothetical protein KUL49_12140 [Alteromonas sp. KUL17]GEA03535.1 hypothetical protein KUL17_24320 [Alteromonas sp. KUL17]
MKVVTSFTKFNPITVFFFFVLAIFSGSSSASSLVYFETQSGDEVRVVWDKTGSSVKDVRFSFFIDESQAPMPVFEDFIRASIENRLYTYDYTTCPTAHCHVGYKRRKNQPASSEPNRFVSEFQGELGTQVAGGFEGLIDAVADDVTEWYEDSTSSSADFVVFKTNGIPSAICTLTSSGCDNVTQITIKPVGANGFEYDYPLLSPTDEDSTLVEHAIFSFNNWIRDNERGQLECSSTSRVVDGIEVIMVTCHFSY